MLCHGFFSFLVRLESREADHQKDCKDVQGYGHIVLFEGHTGIFHGDYMVIFFLLCSWRVLSKHGQSTGNRALFELKQTRVYACL